mgnify:CR=1 FL=1
MYDRASGHLMCSVDPTSTSLESGSSDTPASKPSSGAAVGLAIGSALALVVLLGLVIAARRTANEQSYAHVDDES